MFRMLYALCIDDFQHFFLNLWVDATSFLSITSPLLHQDTVVVVVGRPTKKGVGWVHWVGIKKSEKMPSPPPSTLHGSWWWMVSLYMAHYDAAAVKPSGRWRWRCSPTQPYFPAAPMEGVMRGEPPPLSPPLVLGWQFLDSILFFALNAFSLISSSPLSLTLLLVNRGGFGG